MPRKTNLSGVGADRLSAPCFNEAAARCRGKPHSPPRPPARCMSASMRPRPDAAENAGVEVDPCCVVPASMRPRPDAAENAGRRPGPCRPRRCFNEAAARCRGKRRWRPAHAARRLVASMRPRPDAAENGVQPVAVRRRHAAASMRPRPDAAENGRKRGRLRWAAASFNEAAARCRGKQRTMLAAYESQVAASMRPRPDAAENARSSRPTTTGCRRFNEAAARCRGKHDAALARIIHRGCRSGRDNRGFRAVKSQ